MGWAGVAACLAAPLILAQAPHKPPSLAYATLEHPQFVPAAQASFLTDSDRVIGVMDGTTAKAYAGAIVAQHGAVQDSNKQGPIAVTW